MLVRRRPMKRILRREWPLCLAVLLLWMSLAVLFCLALQSGHGHLTYTLDESYTHMAIAKNLARNGVWGITRYEFAPASASPLWTLVLWSAFAVAGPNPFVPLLLNALFATLALGAASLFLRPF